MKTGAGYEGCWIAMTHRYSMGSYYIVIGDMAKEVGSQVAAMAAQILCLTFRCTAAMILDGGGRVIYEIGSTIVQIPCRRNRREQDKEGKNLGDELHKRRRN